MKIGSHGGFSPVGMRTGTWPKCYDARLGPEETIHQSKVQWMDLGLVGIR